MDRWQGRLGFRSCRIQSILLILSKLDEACCLTWLSVQRGSVALGDGDDGEGDFVGVELFEETAAGGGGGAGGEDVVDEDDAVSGEVDGAGAEGGGGDVLSALGLGEQGLSGGAADASEGGDGGDDESVGQGVGDEA